VSTPPSTLHPVPPPAYLIAVLEPWHVAKAYCAPNLYVVVLCRREQDGKYSSSVVCVNRALGWRSDQISDSQWSTKGRNRRKPKSCMNHWVLWSVQARRSHCFAVRGRGPDLAKKQKGRGLGANVRDTCEQCAGFLISYSNSQGALCKADTAGAVHLDAGRIRLDRACYYSFFSFSFSARLREFIENSRKIDKNMRPILLDS
jgi:hypothetical protein